MPSIVNQTVSAPVVHIECQPTGSATMTFKDERFNGKVMNFHRVRDAVHHATHNGFEQITRASHPEYFYEPYGGIKYCSEEPSYAAFADDFDHGCYKD